MEMPYRKLGPYFEEQLFSPRDGFGSEYYYAFNKGWICV